MKRFLVTGASRGLGAVVMQAFSADYETIGFTRKEYDYLQGSNWNSRVLEVDIIVHCAGGGLGLRGALISANALYDLFMVNLGGAAEINRLALPSMQAKRWGRVVHVLSIASGEAIGSVGYNTVKAALAGYVRSLGREMAPYGIVVCGIAPGAFTAPGNAMERLKEANPSAYQEYLDKRLPRGFMGKAEELVPLIRFLISPQASMMGGSVVAIDGAEGHYYSMP